MILVMVALPVTGCFEMEQAHSNEGDDPESNDHRTNGEDELAHAAIFGMRRSSLTDAEDLSKKTNDENNATENNREPSHGYPFYSLPHRVGKRLTLRQRVHRMQVSPSVRRAVSLLLCLA